MQRYKIMLVDDEADVRDSIARTVDWEACGFELCGVAGGALEAMDLVRKVLPDVVMTDICMPYMDGLEMIAQMQEMYPAIQFVILSGHDDFTYAQQALKYRVRDYLLKPLSHDDMREALEKIHARMDSSRTEQKDLELLGARAEQDRWTLARLQLMSLLYENIAQSGEQYASKDIRFPAYLALMEPVDRASQERVLQETFQGKREMMHLAMMSVAKDILRENDSGVCLYHRDRMVFLLTCGREEGVALLERIEDTQRMYLNIASKAAISTVIRSEREVAEMYQRTLLLIGSEATYDAGSVFMMEEKEPHSHSAALLEGLSGELAHLLRSGDEARIEDFFAQMQAEIEAEHADTAALETLNVIARSAVFTTAMRSGVSTDVLVPMMEREVFYPLEVGTLIRALCTFTCAVCRLINEQRALGARKQAQDIAQYICENFGNPGLSIPEVCEKFDISQTQLSLLFKREMGTSFLQYVLEKRIARAQELLAETDKKIYEIALETGFEDPGYFSYCFKQRTGMTPKNFRQGAQSGHA